MEKHSARNRAGQYRETHKCDGCGKPVGVEHDTDDEVCGTGDGPGFYLCRRVRCQRALETMSVDQRRAHYEARRNPPSEARIKSLSQEAAEHGDLSMVQVCDRAAAGDVRALAEVARVLVDAAAQTEESIIAWEEVDVPTRRAWMEDGGEVGAADLSWTPESLGPMNAEVVDHAPSGRAYMRAGIYNAWRATRDLAAQAARITQDTERAEAWERIDQRIARAARVVREEVRRQLAGGQ